MPNTCKSSENRFVAIQTLLSGGRVSNTQATCLLVGDNLGKPGLVPNNLILTHVRIRKGFSLNERLMSDQLVGEVTAHQGNNQ